MLASRLLLTTLRWWLSPQRLSTQHSEEDRYSIMSMNLRKEKKGSNIKKRET